MRQYKPNRKYTPRFMWMAVEPETETPIHIENTARELAEKLGMTIGNIFTAIRKDWDGTRTGRKIIRVKIDDDTEE